METTKRTFLSGFKARFLKNHVRFKDLGIEFRPAKETLKTAAVIAVSMLCLGAVLYGADTGVTKLIGLAVSAISGQ